MFCYLVKVGAIICLNMTSGFKEVECQEYKDTGLTMCIDGSLDTECILELSDEFINTSSDGIAGGRDEVSLVNFINRECSE